MGEIVFSQPQALKALNEIIHPAVIREIKNKIKIVKEENKTAIVILDAALLFETGLDKITDFNVCVWMSSYLQTQRLLAKTALDEKQLKVRFKSQLSVGQKKLKADFVINNSGSFLQLQKQVEDIFRKIKENNK